MARISVIIPVYNRQALAERALRSVLAQDVADREVIVVDDGSQPPFRLPSALVDDANIHVIRHDENRGAGSARNTGVKAAQADWIAFLDSDDWWPLGTLRPRLDLAEQNFATTRYAMVAYAAGFVLYDERSGRRETRIPRASDNPLHFVSGCWFSPGSTMLARRQIFDRIGPFDPQLRRLEDFDWFLRFALAGGRLDRWPGTAAMIDIGSKPTLPVLEEAARHLREKYSLGTSPHLLPPSYIRRLDAYFDLERASIFAAQGQWASTLYYMVRSLLRAPRFTLHLERFWDVA